jgi:hypothetical protein
LSKLICRSRCVEAPEEPEESDEDFMKRTSREAKRKKDVGNDADEAADTRAEL